MIRKSIAIKLQISRVSANEKCIIWNIVIHFVYCVMYKIYTLFLGRISFNANPDVSQLYTRK